jgi:uncharacterized membrane protein
MTLLLIGALGFVAIHAVPGSGLRARLIAALGRGPYLGLFSLASLAFLVLAVLGYNRAVAGPPWWAIGDDWRWINAVLMLLPFWLVVAGGAGNPSSGGAGKGLAADGRPGGIFTVTRHPIMAGIAIWAILHLIANPDPPSWVFFGALLVTACLAFLLQDARMAASLGEPWRRFQAQTSVVPFAAAVAGRAPLDLPGILNWRLAIVVAVWAVVVWGHEWAIGLPAVPM